jgi:hypothetical protein
VYNVKIQACLLWKSNEHYIFCVCVSVALVIQHAQCMGHIILSSVACLAHTMFFHILINSVIFRNKLLNIKCVF